MLATCHRQWFLIYDLTIFSRSPHAISQGLESCTYFFCHCRYNVLILPHILKAQNRNLRIQGMH